MGVDQEMKHDLGQNGADQNRSHGPVAHLHLTRTEQKEDNKAEPCAQKGEEHKEHLQPVVFSVVHAPGPFRSWIRSVSGSGMHTLVT